jgi:hypothetical protein
MNLVCVTIDAIDPEAVARFWNEALGGEGVEVHDDIATCTLPGSPLLLEFVPVPEPKERKNRLHLGCSAGGLEDLESELSRLLGLGAEVAWEEEFPAELAERYRNLVLVDVEGNEFCLGAGTW